MRVARASEFQFFWKKACYTFLCQGILMWSLKIHNCMRCKRARHFPFLFNIYKLVKTIETHKLTLKSRNLSHIYIFTRGVIFEYHSQWCKQMQLNLFLTFSLIPTSYFAISLGASNCIKKNMLIFKKNLWKKRFFEISDYNKRQCFSSM